MEKKSAQEVLTLIKDQDVLSTTDMHEMRRNFTEFYLKFSSQEELEVETHIIDYLPAYSISAPEVNHDKVLLFFHGGGFTMGSTREHLDLCGKLSRASGIAVLSVDYRLAPEHVFPSQVEDCIKSYLWLLEKGLKPSNIIIGGISAGGNLALSTVLNLKNEGVELPQGIMCMSPAADLNFPGDSVNENKDNDWVTPQRLENIQKTYLKQHSPHEALASPTLGDLKDLPPIFIQYGLNELLRDDIRLFCQKLEENDVQVTCHGWENMFHCWQIFSSVLNEGQQAIEEAGQFVNQLFRL